MKKKEFHSESKGLQRGKKYFILNQMDGLVMKKTLTSTLKQKDCKEEKKDSTLKQKDGNEENTSIHSESSGCKEENTSIHSESSGCKEENTSIHSESSGCKEENKKDSIHSEITQFH